MERSSDSRLTTSGCAARKASSRARWLVVRVDHSPRAPLAALVLHLEAGNQGPLRQVQLQAALAIATGERARGRVVVMLGDFNMQPAEAEPHFVDAGYVRAAGEAIDQILARQLAERE